MRGPRHSPSGESWEGNLDPATAPFKAALAFCRHAGYRPALAWTCCGYAVLLREGPCPCVVHVSESPVTAVLRHAQDDRSRVVSLLDEFLAISSERGVPPLRECIVSRREIWGA